MTTHVNTITLSDLTFQPKLWLSLRGNDLYPSAGISFMTENA